MCHRSAPFPATIRKVFLAIAFRLFLCQLLFIIFASCGMWAQDASTGALRGTVWDAQGSAITNADIVVISGDGNPLPRGHGFGGTVRG